MARPVYERMFQMAREGHTADVIGLACGYQPRSVRAILNRFGVPFKSLRQQPKERCARALNDGLPLRHPHGKYIAFKQQRRAAARRGIEWQFTFAEWVQVWAESGKWESRGRHVGQYCMARFGDVGPYSVGNVEIIPFVENIRQARALDWARRKANKAAEAAQSGIEGADPLVSDSLNLHALKHESASHATPLN